MGGSMHRPTYLHPCPCPRSHGIDSVDPTHPSIHASHPPTHPPTHPPYTPTGVADGLLQPDLLLQDQEPAHLLVPQGAVFFWGSNGLYIIYYIHKHIFVYFVFQNRKPTRCGSISCPPAYTRRPSTIATLTSTTAVRRHREGRGAYRARDGGVGPREAHLRDRQSKKEGASHVCVSLCHLGQTHKQTTHPLPPLTPSPCRPNLII